MKKYYIIGGIIIVILIAGFLLFQKFKIDKLNDQIQLQSVELSTLNDSVAVLVSKNGDLTFKVQSVQVEADNAKKALELAGFEIKELKKKDINWRKVNFALQAKIEALGKGTIIFRDSITPGRTDSVPAKVGEWNDRFLFLYPKLTGLKMDFEYKYMTGISILLEGEKKNIVSVYLTDPDNPKIRNARAQITNANSITIPAKKHWWGWKYIEFGSGLALGYLIFK